ncbi:hypothetical protein EDB84DRAFT_1584160, partial [Lactarius hengduanensis]
MATTVYGPLMQLRAPTTPTMTTVAAGSQPMQRSAADYDDHSAGNNGHDNCKDNREDPGGDLTTPTITATSPTMAMGQSANGPTQPQAPPTTTTTPTATRRQRQQHADDDDDDCGGDDSDDKFNNHHDDSMAKAV